MRSPTGNRLLDSLPDATLALLLPQLEQVSLPIQTLLFQQDRGPRHVHFLQSGLASTVVDMEGGGAIETGLCGKEGFPECTHLLGPIAGNVRCFMQVSGEGLRVSFSTFEDLFRKEPAVRYAVQRLVQHDALALAQLSACNRLHGVEKRLARWLLMVHDRVGQSTLALTQEFLAEMLGARRSTVNLAAGTLQRAGFIRFSRGQITLIDPVAMQSVACECYPILRGYYDRLFA